MASLLWRNEDYVFENTSSKWRRKNFPFSSPFLSKILIALLPQTPLVFGVWGSNKLRLFFYSNSALFVGGSAKILFAPGARYPSYATDCGWLNAGSGFFGSRPAIFKDTVERLGQWRIKGEEGQRVHFLVLG